MIAALVSTNLTWVAVAGVVAVGFGASFAQGAVGFGFALVAVPLLSLVLAPATAVVAVFFLGAISSVLTVVRHHEHVEWTETRRLSIGAVVAMPLGGLILVTAPASVLRLVLGVVTCAAALYFIAPASRRKKDPVGFRPLTTYLVGGVSGVLNTSLATNGPPLVVYLRARGLVPVSFRSTISMVFTISNVVGLGVLVAVGAVHSEALVVAALAALPALAGWAAGNALSSRLSHHHFNVVVDGLLLVAGVLSVLKAVLG